MLTHTHERTQAQRSGVLLNTIQSKRDIKVPLREFSIDDKKMSSLLSTRRNLYTHIHTHTRIHMCCIISLGNMYVTHFTAQESLPYTHRFILVLTNLTSN